MAGGGRGSVARGWAKALPALALGLALCLWGRLAGATPSAPGVGLVGVRFGGDAKTTRVVLDLDAPVTGRMVGGESNGSRLVIALPPLLSTRELRGRGQGLVAAWSVRDDARGSRFILDVAAGASAIHRFLIPPSAEGQPWRYVIDINVGRVDDNDPLATLAATSPTYRRLPDPRLAAANPDTPAPPALALAVPVQTASMAFAREGGSFAALTPTTRFDLPAVHAMAPAARPAAPTTHVARARKVIVIDAGHGGHDPGARSLVRNEKDITLAAALDLKARLEKIGHYRVVLTRSSDVFIPLDERVRIARRAGADLFISLHADSAGSDPTPHGASVYTLSDSGQTRVNYVLGPHEWFSRAGSARTDPGVRQILLDLTQRSTRNRSAEFAGLLIDHISDRVDLLPRSHRDAGYFVLLAPDVPAVLLEMGFITNPGDEMRLTDPAQRDKLMGGVAAAINAYFSGGTRLAAG